MIVLILLLILSIVFLIRRHANAGVGNPYSGKNLVILIIDLSIMGSIITMLILTFI